MDVRSSENLLKELLLQPQTRIVFLILDGLGGLPIQEGGPTELEAAHTPNLDALATRYTTGLLDPIGAGLTPGSGPAHLALFGYDPLHYVIGRGVLGALGLGFAIKTGDVAARVNFATVDGEGRITDRRAGRLATEKNRELAGRLAAGLRPPAGYEVFFETEKEHRALFVLRGPGLSGELEETDPQTTGVPPRACRASVPEAERTAEIVRELVAQAAAMLRPEPQGNMILLRGFDTFRAVPGFSERYGLRALAIASYPMYRGLARLVGMELHAPTTTVAEEFEALRERWGEFDFYFVHVKPPDSRGEDGDFAGKVRAIEEVDALVPQVTALGPDVLVVTGDHSTPAALRSHSWHPVPLLLAARTARPDGARAFGEQDCLKGGLGRRPSVELVALALAHAGRLTKFGA